MFRGNKLFAKANWTFCKDFGVIFGSFWGTCGQLKKSIILHKFISHEANVTMSAKRLTETRGGGTRTVNMIRDVDLRGPSSFCLQGRQSQGGGTLL